MNSLNNYKVIFFTSREQIPSFSLFLLALSSDMLFAFNIYYISNSNSRWTLENQRVNKMLFRVHFSINVRLQQNHHTITSFH